MLAALVLVLAAPPLALGTRPGRADIGIGRLDLSGGSQAYLEAGHEFHWAALDRALAAASSLPATLGLVQQETPDTSALQKDIASATSDGSGPILLPVNIANKERARQEQALAKAAAKDREAAIQSGERAVDALPRKLGVVAHRETSGGLSSSAQANEEAADPAPAPAPPPVISDDIGKDASLDKDLEKATDKASQDASHDEKAPPDASQGNPAASGVCLELAELESHTTFAQQECFGIAFSLHGPNPEARLTAVAEVASSTGIDAHVLLSIPSFLLSLGDRQAAGPGSPMDVIKHAINQISGGSDPAPEDGGASSGAAPSPASHEASQQAQDELRLLDKNLDGFVNESEILDHLLEVVAKRMRAQLEPSFQAADRNKDGQLNAKEFQQILDKAGSQHKDGHPSAGTDAGKDEGDASAEPKPGDAGTVIADKFEALEKCRCEAFQRVKANLSAQAAILSNVSCADDFHTFSTEVDDHVAGICGNEATTCREGLRTALASFTARVQACVGQAALSGNVTARSACFCDIQEPSELKDVAHWSKCLPTYQVVEKYLQTRHTSCENSTNSTTAMVDSTATVDSALIKALSSFFGQQGF